uniref:(northern house mosquito) hypothetical protein n=1 Tax=Culex pipiens TaxID=7175 RepID=A0A8D8F5X5_CULPI
MKTIYLRRRAGSTTLPSFDWIAPSASRTISGQSACRQRLGFVPATTSDSKPSPPAGELRKMTTIAMSCAKSRSPSWTSASVPNCTGQSSGCATPSSVPEGNPARIPAWGIPAGR